MKNKRLNPSTPLNKTIKLLAEGDLGAGSLLAMVMRENPLHTMDVFHQMDSKGIYGKDIWKLWMDSDQDYREFMKRISE